ILSIWSTVSLSGNSTTRSSTTKPCRIEVSSLSSVHRASFMKHLPESHAFCQLLNLLRFDTGCSAQPGSTTLCFAVLHTIRLPGFRDPYRTENHCQARSGLYPLIR